MAADRQRKTFLSYSRANKDFAIRLAKELKSEGFDIWLDQLDIPLGARWDVEVERALEESEIFMIIMTPASIGSENVRDEIGYAIDNGKRFLPVLLENCIVPLRLRRFQYVDFTNKSFDDGVEAAKGLLRGLVGQPTIPRAEFTGSQNQAEAERKAKEEADRLAALKAEEERLAKEKADLERKSKEEAERLYAQKTEEERQAKAKADAERKAKTDARRKAKEEADRLAAQKAEAERLAKEKTEEELAAKARAERERKEKEDREAKAEAERLAAQEFEEQRLAKQKADVLYAKAKADRLAAQKAEDDHLTKQKAEEELAAKVEAERKAKEEQASQAKAHDERKAKEKAVPVDTRVVSSPQISTTQRKTMSRGLVVGMFSIAILAVIGIGIGAITKFSLFASAQPTNTAISVATSTPRPTQTIQPSSTAQPSSTPNIAATQFLKNVQQAEVNMIAFYPLDETAANQSKFYLNDINLKNAPFMDGGVYCNGEYEYDNGGNNNPDQCLIETPILRNLDYQNFSISIDFKVSEYPKYSIYPDGMNVIMGGNWWRWNGFYLTSEGKIGYWYGDNDTMDCQGQYQVDTWHNAVLTYDGQVGKLYLDGTMICSATFAIDTGGGEDDKTILNTNYSIGSVFKGYLRNLKVYNKAISP